MPHLYGTNVPSYGGISRNTNTFWKSTVVSGTNVTPTRNLMLQYIAQVSKTTGEMPSLGIMGFGTWTLLAQDFTSQERYMITPGNAFGADTKAESLFRALDVAGVPFYADPYCPEGTVYFLNSNYLNLYVHDQASFAFTGFESLLSNYQLGYIGAVLTIAELVLTKPKTAVKVTNVGSITI